MKTPLSPRESTLLVACAALALLAAAGPHVPAPPAYHSFADTRAWGALPNAGDVLSNLAFALAGLVGAWKVWRLPRGALTNMQRAMAGLFFAGLVLTAACSAWYHLGPDDARLVVDRSGMAVAFAGLLGLAVTTRVGERAAAFVGLAFLAAAPLALHASVQGELLPWVVLQFGGMALLVLLALGRPLPDALPVRWLAIVAIYCAAKACEGLDGWAFAASGYLFSGHTLKHLVAACAALPVIAALGWHNAAEPRGALRPRTLRRISS
ncbi:hypothetical protein [Ramlibacter sp. PS4R-6]|uniref:hypothetical protein n=1 Tax=Ramlibacter sp. PS4R-6 TaxID=3133438 RepID=UPI0030AB19B4